MLILAKLQARIVDGKKKLSHSHESPDKIRGERGEPIKVRNRRMKEAVIDHRGWARPCSASAHAARRA